MPYQGTLIVRTAVQPRLKEPFQSHTEPLAVTQEVTIDVVDGGPGIPAEVKEKSFEPIYSTKEGGMGLGSAIIDRIIYNHKGRIEVDSQPRRGTTMRIHLPILPTTLDTSRIRARQ